MDLGREEKKREKKIRLEKRKRESRLNIFFFLKKKNLNQPNLNWISVFLIVLFREGLVLACITVMGLSSVVLN